MYAPDLTAADYLAALQALMPRGRVWPRDQDAIQTKTLAGCAPSFARHAARSKNLITDGFPASAYELLPEWESTLGLPDPCAGEAPTVQQRRAQVVARLTATGGQSIAYFTAVASALGYAITITQFTPSRFGWPIGRPFGGNAWAFAWQVSAPTFTIAGLQFGGSFGSPFSSWGNNVLQCEIATYAPAHTTVLFSYS
ncbi:YmfQ family protein [Burkholderia vietnamiensis]|uniref:YmfQ family protein n=1 Tax=Burkholderia vietnamiensis TaxID=60552 RepID=UPI001593BC36|nr:YmfQ family protein [Burkholderia vietnamiensis]